MKQKNTRQMFKTGFDQSLGLVEMTDERLEQMKRVLLGMHRDITAALDARKIRFALAGGSALGAVRHGGFIPWDDDIDLIIPRSDYDRLLDEFDEILGDGYLLCTPERTPDHGMLNAQIKKKGTVYQSFNELSKAPESCGVCVDIFIIENVSNNGLLRRLHGVLALAAGYLSTCRKTYHDLPYLERFLTPGSESARAFRKKARIGGWFRWLSLDWVTHFANRCYSLCKNHRSRMVTIPSGRNHFFGELQKREDVCESVRVNFAGLQVPVPKGYDAYLTGLYGPDYMTPPPAGKRESHPIMALDLGEIPADKTGEEV